MSVFWAQMFRITKYELRRKRQQYNLKLYIYSCSVLNNRQREWIKEVL